MTADRIEKILREVKAGTVEVEAAVARLEKLPFEDIGFARVDHHREIRQGFPEVVLCEGKTVPQVLGIARRIVEAGSTLLGTRATAEMADAMRAILPDLEHNSLARTVVVRRGPERPACSPGRISVISAGTSDLPVAEEAAVTAEVMGNRVARLYDVGVSGIHRLLADRDEIAKASVIVVVAGMEGALPSVVGGLVSVPVVAVPTRVGYGASFGGLAALLGMMNSCAPGVTVVNIDNGFGAGYAASLINRVGTGREARKTSGP